MLLFIDTCFWSHARELAEVNVLDLRPYLHQFRVGVTEKTWMEITHFHLEEFVAKADLYVVPLTDRELDQNRAKFPTLQGLDNADQTLIITALRDQGVILTDDGDMLLEAQALGIRVVRLPMFCLDLCSQHRPAEN